MSDAFKLMSQNELLDYKILLKAAKVDIEELKNKDGELDFDDILIVLEKYEKIAEPLNT